MSNHVSDDYKAARLSITSAVLLFFISCFVINNNIIAVIAIVVLAVNLIYVLFNNKMGTLLILSIIAALLIWGTGAFILAVIGLITVAIVMIRVVQMRRAGERKALTRQQLAKGVIYTLMIVMIISVNSINVWITKTRAEQLIKACKEYSLKHGNYPNKLVDLVPDILKRIPPAKYSLTFNKFEYALVGDKHMLYYVKIPPFGLQTYVLEDDKWQMID